MANVQTNFRAGDMIGASASKKSSGDNKPRSAATAQKSESQSDSEQTRSNEPPKGTSEEVVAWVGNDPSKARKALAAERKDESPRTSVIEPLQRIVDEDKKSRAAKKAAEKNSE